LTAAAELVRAHGYRGVTIEGVAARAGAGKQTIYRWWSSKDALLLDVFLDAITERLARSNADARASLRERVQATAAVLADGDLGPHVAELIGAAQHDSALAAELLERLVRPARASNLEVLRDAQRAGELRNDIDPEVMADALFGPIWFRLLITKDALSPAYVDAVVDAVMAGWEPPQRGTARKRVRAAQPSGPPA
jgi:AcrR family transcriptional regulator